MPDQETRFLENLAVAPTYPDTLLHRGEEAAVTKERREHYAEKKARVFDALRGGREPLVILDFGAGPDSGKDSGNVPASSWRRKGKLYLVRDVEGLRTKLSWPSPASSTTEPGGLVKDPPLRVMHVIPPEQPMMGKITDSTKPFGAALADVDDA
ncbi:telomerase reverse transcriptase [Colletotrichum tofieldiae]|nr:telomerase reverse transcriptase [Colletotrichum tofieldiae]GKT75309.1 telomerase reverse transcriptase [Colletotrichum tofieldiae]